MATVQNTRQTLSELLKIVYEPNMNESIRSLVFFFSALSKVKHDGKGKQYTFATHLGRNTAVAARAADDYLETGLPEVVKNGTVNSAYVHVPFEITNDLMEASKGDSHAFADGMELIQSSARNMLKRELNRMAVGDGRGIVATLTGNLASGAATATCTVDSTKYLEDGMLLDGWNGVAGTTIRNGALTGGVSQGPWLKVVSVIDSTTFTAGLSDGANIPAGIIATDVLTRKKNAYVNVSRYSYEPNGLRLMADDGTLDPSGGLHGISASSYSRWKGINRDASGYSASPALVSAMAIQFRRWSATFFNTIWAHDNQAFSLLYGDEGSYREKRFEGAATEIGESYEDIVINVSGQKVKVKTDLDLPEAEIQFFDSKVIGYLELWGIKLLEQADGLFLTPWRDATGQRLAQIGFYGWAGNFFTRIRNGIGRAYGLNVPAALPW
jgi:hypothetical protein